MRWNRITGDEGEDKFVPGPPSSQHQSDSVACQDPSQTREVRMPVGRLLKYPLIHLSLTGEEESGSLHGYEMMSRLGHKEKKF